jgi:60 kDa SS-A/Ro ribonucleoprotein
METTGKISDFRFKGGTYYVGEKDLTKENYSNIINLVKQDGIKALNIVKDISNQGRASSNNPAIFVLLLILTHGSVEAKRQASVDFPSIVRTGTHLFIFASYVKQLRGWGRAIRRAIDNWYNGKNRHGLELQLLKYKNRESWTHKDVLRLNHVTPKTELADLFAYAVKGSVSENMPMVRASQELFTKDIATERAIQLITENRLTHEMIPTELLAKTEIWKAILTSIPLNALLRSLGRLSANGVIKQVGNDELVKSTLARLTNAEEVKKSRMHPYNVLLAMLTYSKGRGEKGDLSWTVNQPLVASLEQTYYLAFGNVEATNKSFYLAVDVSSSMSSAFIGKSNLISAAQAAGAMAMVTARVENDYVIKGFTSAGGYGRGNTGLTDLGITGKTGLQEAMQKVQLRNFGSTDCSLPIVEALNEGLFVDCFVIYTDNETWSGKQHVSVVLNKYRNTVNPKAKLIVVGMTSSGFTVNEPTDLYGLDVVGFDSSTPNLISEFAKI